MALKPLIAGMAPSSTVNLATPGAIGETTPAAGTFTTLTTSDAVTNVVPATGTAKIALSSPVGNTRADVTELFSITAGKYSRSVYVILEDGRSTFGQLVAFSGGFTVQGAFAIYANAGFGECSNGTVGVTYPWKCSNLVATGTFDVTGVATHSARISLASYTVGTLPSASPAGGLIYVSDAAVAPCVAFSNGTNWKRCDNAATTVI